MEDRDTTSTQEDVEVHTLGYLPIFKAFFNIFVVFVIYLL